MEAFATADDYAGRYGEPADRSRVELLLQDASAYLLSEFEAVFGEHEQGKCKAFDRAAAMACCLLVNRVLTAPAAMAGATQYSQGAGGYTASVTFGQALGEMYLGKSIRALLGLDAQVRRVLTPMERGEQ